VEHARRVAARIEAGMVFINSSANTRPEVPFGGVRNSGFGRALSELGIGQFNGAFPSEPAHRECNSCKFPVSGHAATGDAMYSRAVRFPPEARREATVWCSNDDLGMGGAATEELLRSAEAR
jgi:Aldehyde dehydrogenase family